MSLNTGSHFSCQAIIYEYFKQKNANFTDDYIKYIDY